MSQDYNLANQSRTSFRQELNNILTAIVQNNKSATEPSPAFGCMLWADTTSNKLKQRNVANNAWFEIGDLDTANLGLLKNVASVITASLLAADAVETAKIKNDAVTLAKMAHGTADKILGFSATGVPEEKDAVSGGGMQVFTASGTFTVPAGITQIMAWVIGAGGGGSGSNKGGGGGGEAIRFVKSVTPASGITVTIGAKGTGGITANDGTVGGDTTFHGVTAKGGVGGSSSGSGGLGGTGGTLSGTTLDQLPGHAGQANNGGGRNGSSPNDITVPGDGKTGEGGASAANPGFDGGDGLVIIFY